ncbi:11510_t:CDS:2, partial [Funneliformis geosporum]
RVELYVDGDRSFDPKNTLNGIRITLTTVRTHMQRVANEALHYQGLLNMANGQEIGAEIKGVQGLDHKLR